MADFFVIENAMRETRKGKEVVLATIVKATGSTPRREGTMMAVLEDGKIYGTIGGGELEREIIKLSMNYIAKEKSGLVNLKLEENSLKMTCGGEVDVFLDICRIKPKLLIVGGGHVGHAIYKAASILDFHIVIFEDREEFLNEKRFPKAQELILGDFEESLKNYPVDNSTYIVIVTRGHEFDEEALEAVINSKAKYIGVMGSRNKVSKMILNLEEKGIDKNKLKKVYTPIGLAIGGETPEEIAISILSEILLIKNNGSCDHMSNNI